MVDVAVAREVRARLPAARWRAIGVALRRMARAAALSEGREDLEVAVRFVTDAERDEMNSHVVHTYNFLKQIPWGRAFRQVPEIAGAHHEKLDGSGYPNKLEGDEIPVPARMMTISDIYDALTASDRPYKKAMPAEKALDILSGDVKRGQLDKELFDVFVGARVWTRTLRG